MKKRVFCFLITLVFLLNANIFAATETTLPIYKWKIFPWPSKEKKILNLFLSDSTGSKNFNLQQIAATDTFYIAITSTKKLDLKRYYKKFKKNLILKQQKIELKPLAFVAVKNEKKTEKLIGTFAGNQISKQEPFAICYKKQDSGKIQLPPLPLTFAEEYQIFYREGKEAFEATNYLQSFEKLQHFLSDDSRLINLSFFLDATALLRNSIEKYISAEKDKFNFLEKEFTKTSDESFKQDFEILKNKTEIAQQTFSPYFQFYDSPEDSTIAQELNDLITQSENQINNIENIIRNRKLSIFNTSNYENNEFSIFVDVLTRMLCKTDTISLIDTIPSLDLTTLNILPEQKKQLVNLEFYERFSEIVSLINNNIKTNDYILDRSAMDNLYFQIDMETQPYYKILSAFNSLCKKNYKLFAKYMREAYWKCTDEDLITDLEFQNLSFRAAKLDLSRQAVKTLNSSLQSFARKDTAKAFSQFQKAKSLSNNFCVPFYFLGKIEFQKGNVFVGIASMKEAIEKYPDYISPRKSIIKHYLETKQYTKALFSVQSAINQLPIWDFYFSKAQIFAALGKYREAIDICEICLRINPHNFEEYLFLGDMNLAINDRHTAKTFYAKAAKISPNNPKYEKRMQAFEE